MPPYVVLEKRVGETPLQAIQKYRQKHPELADLPMAYAGRLDPMASGQLLILIGDECKKQAKYHSLDKGYRFEVLLGSSSDTGDVLGLVNWQEAADMEETQLRRVAAGLVGPLALPYPKFSSRTVKGKPLHVWTLEERLDEIEIPTADTTVYKLKLAGLRSASSDQVHEEVLARIGMVPSVTEDSKALGRDFRRSEVLAAWRVWHERGLGREVQIAAFECEASSGTYMRSLAEEIGRRLGTVGLAYSIHRFAMGRYQYLPFGLGFWRQRYS